MITIDNQEYYLYGYYANDKIKLDNFLYRSIDISAHQIQAIRSDNSPLKLFNYGFEITAKDLTSKDFKEYWYARLQYPAIEASNADKHLYEYRTTRGVLYSYTKNTYSYSLYLKTDKEKNFRIYIPKSSFKNFKFKSIKSLLGEEIYAVSLIEKWGDNTIMQIHHPNQIILSKNTNILRLFEGK